MKHLFSYCSSLRLLPDISKWNTKNLENIDYLIIGNSLLLTIPDISKWNIKNINTDIINNIIENS